MCMKIETLHEIFRHNHDGHTLKYNGKCCICGKETIVHITKTSSGYGFLGGVMREIEPRGSIIECDCCFKNGIQNNG